MTVTFKFKIDQKVKVEKLGIEGIVAMCAVDNCGNCYYVKAANNSDWYYEKHLIDAEA
jgi:hypothetical protein